MKMFFVVMVFYWVAASGLSVRLSPEAVVKAQMEALKNGDLPSYSTEATRPMVYCSRWTFSASLRVSDDRHLVRVRVYPAGSSSAVFAGVVPFLDYDFRLRKGENWQTEAVRPVEKAFSH